MFLTPALIGLGVFLGFPLVFGFFVSLHDWDILTPRSPRGVGNYSELVQDPLFWQSMRNTAVYTVGAVTLSTVLGLGVALLLNQHLRGQSVYRTIVYLPVVAATAATAVVWRQIYNGNFGFLNEFLGVFGIGGQNWLGDARFAMAAVIVMSVWHGLGFTTILFLAGLQSVPQQYYDAALADGAGPWQRFRHITLPLISPTTFFVIVIGVINSWQVFNQIFVMTSGGPGFSTHTIVYLVYTTGFRFFRMGYASTMAMALFSIILVLTVVQLKLQNRWVHYQA